MIAAEASEKQKEGARQRAGRLRTVRAGFAHHQAGRLHRAEALYRKALHRNPDDANALHLLGVIAFQCGEVGTALRLIERALPELQDVPDVHLNHGNALREAGRPAEAVTSYRRALALQPDYGMAHNNLAAAFNEQQQFAAGLASANRAIELIPEFFGAYIHRAASLMGLGRFAEAETPLRRALDLAPDHAQSHCDLGWVLARLGRHDEAVTFLERAVALDPKDATIHFALGATPHLIHDLAASEAGLRRAVALAPDYTAAWHELGTVLRSSGRFEEALLCFHCARDLDPDWPEPYRSLAVTGRQTANGAQRRRLETVTRLRPLGFRQDLGGLCPGHAAEQWGQCDEAFACFAEANALYRQERATAGERFDIDALRAQIGDLIKLSTPALFSATASWGTASALPVFIVGMPRSGTSLVEQIAASHSRVLGAGELTELEGICRALSAHNGSLPVEKWDAPFSLQLAERHVARLQALSDGATRVIDKMPDNIFFLWIVAALFPSARVIFCRRDLRDVSLSCYFHLFTEGHLYAYDLADCGARALEAERLARHWRGVLPLRMMVVDYEQLVEDLEGESRRLIEFLGLEWEPACLDFHLTGRPVFTASAWQVRQPLYRRSVGRWRDYERHLAPLLGMLAQGQDSR